MPLEIIQTETIPEINAGMLSFSNAFTNCATLTNITFPTCESIDTSHIVWKEECVATKSFIDMLHKICSEL